jgi:hypothetical protein
MPRAGSEEAEFRIVQRSRIGASEGSGGGDLGAGALSPRAIVPRSIGYRRPRSNPRW